MRRYLLLGTASLVALLLFAWGPEVRPALAEHGNRWTGEYFNNRDLVGGPIHVRLDAAIDFDWGGASPVPGIVPANNFSVRWSGTQNFPEGGNYTFLAASDDGVRVWVDDRLIVDAWYDQTRNLHTGQISLSAGLHYVRVEYYDAGDAASISVLWRPANALVPPGGWEATYFPNRDLSGSGVSIGVIPNLDYNWGADSPLPGTIPANDFSARWYGFPNLEGGRYTFVAWADDGIRVHVAGQTVIDAWSPAIYREHRGTADLAPGVNTVRVEYFEGGDQARVFVYWIREGAAPSTGGTTGSGTTGGVPISSVTATINTARLNVRSGPGVGWPILARVSRGEVYTAIGRNNDKTWVQISGPGFTGWVSDRYVRLSADITLLPLAEVTGGGSSTVLQVQANSSLRIRRGPGTNQARVAALHSGETATVIGRTADSSWLQIRTSAGVQGWVSAPFVSYVAGGPPLSTIPITG